MKERLAAAVIVCALLGLLAVVRSRRREAGPGPDAVVYDAFEAARKGDAPGYVDCFSGELRRRLEAAAGDAGGMAAFGEGLRRRVQGVTGIAVFPVGDQEESGPAAKATGGEVRLRVEIVFPERNQVQEYRLRRVRGKWKIVGASGAESSVMPIPYGTLVFRVPESAPSPPDRAASREKRPRVSEKGGSPAAGL